MLKPIGSWTCESCGAGADAKAKDCCDYCILTIFSGYHALELNEAFENYNNTNDWNNDTCDYSPDGDKGDTN
jgi:hypothetical protein